MTEVVAAMQTNDASPTKKDGAGDAGAVNGTKTEEMTSKDYYFDSYAHFGIHEASRLFLFRTISILLVGFLIYFLLLRMEEAVCRIERMIVHRLQILT
jgi:hypothetical protein